MKQDKKEVSKEEIKMLLDFERLITNMSSKFINLRAEEINSEIQNALKDVVEFFGAEIGALYRITSDRENTEIVQAYISGGAKPMHRMDSSVIYPYLLDKTLKGIPVMISSTKDLPEEAAVDRNTLVMMGIVSMISIPIKDSGQFNYAITLASLKEKYDWNSNLISRIQLIGEIFVTELKRSKTAEEIRLKERAIETSISGIGITDLDGTIIYVNESILKMWNLKSEKEILGKSVFDFFETDRIALVLQELKTSGGVIGEDKGKRNDGSLFDIQYSASIIMDNNSDPKFMFGSFIDITDLKLKREALEKSEHSLAEAQRIAHVGNWSWDIANNLQDNSDEAFRIFGLEPQMKGFTTGAFFNLVHPQDKQHVEEAIKLALINPTKDYNMNYRIIRPDGEERVVHTQGEVIINEKNEAIKMMGTVHDITELTRVEEESKRLMNELAHIERIGTVGAMTVALAHEINQPLAAILNNAEAALRNLKNEEPDLTEIKEILADIVSDNKRAGEVINRLRSMVKKSEVQNEPFHLNMIITEVLNLLNSEILICKASVIVELDSSVQQFMGDRIQMQQVVLNLMMNALDAVMTKPQELRKIKFTTSSDNKSGITVSVTDSGSGIKEENLDDLFEAFYTTKKNGMGMGLPICKSIIEAKGGRIWAENLEKSGAKFSFWLPYINQSTII